MRASLRLATLLSGAATAVALSAGPALAVAPQTQTVANPQAGSVGLLTDPSDGYCLEEERDQVKLGADGRLYECDYYPDLGFWWLPYWG